MTQRRALRILLSAYACEPGRGSEPGVGWQWALALARRGHDVWVLTRANNRERIDKALVTVPPEQRNRLRFIYFDLHDWVRRSKRGHLGVLLYYAWWQRGIVKIALQSHAEFRFDLVHHITFGSWRQPTHLHQLGLPVVFGPVGGGESTPPCLESTLPFRERINEKLRTLANRMALASPSLQANIRRNRWNIAKTEETAGFIRRMDAPCDVHLEIGIDAERITPRASDSRRDAALSCLFAGRLVGWKGPHIAIEAVAQACERGSDIRLTIIGKGPMRKRLQELAHHRGVQDRVQFIEWLTQEQLFDKYREHDMFLFPSFHDSSGNVVLEAFAHGLPVVCLDLGGPASLVAASTGIKVPADENSISALAQQLSWLQADPRRLSLLSSGARAYAETRTWDAIVGSVYSEIEAFNIERKRY